MDHPEHIVNHLGEDREKWMDAVVPPVFQSSNFAFRDVSSMRTGLSREFDAPFYTRGHNPTTALLRRKMAALEGTEDALVFASGSAAVAAAVLSEVSNGDHVVCVQKPYSWTHKLLSEFLPRFGVTTTFVDGEKVGDIADAINGNTKVIYLESPNSVTFEMQDIAGVKAAVGEDLTLIIDNSYATPIFQTPAAMGVDIVIHSASKYLSGHSDVVAGVICADEARIRRIFRSEFMTLGGVISPHDAWLIIRGLRTLPVRMKEVDRVAGQVIGFLETHPKVKEVNYPFAKQNPQLELAKKQMTGAGGLFSMRVDAKSIDQVEAFCAQLPSFLLACSWGGYESLMFPTCALYGIEESANPDLPWDLIRFYIGLEDPGKIIEEFDTALALL